MYDKDLFLAKHSLCEISVIKLYNISRICLKSSVLRQSGKRRQSV